MDDAAKAYYQDGCEKISNYEYDRLYDELVELERETGIVMSSSPTQKVGYEVLSSLPKERHQSPMLSLEKTKSVDTLAEWLGDKEGLLSWKLDGLTVVLSYEEGLLVKGVTRGNGEIGEVITQNVRAFDNVPCSIPFHGKLVLRGEAIIRYSDFQEINESLPEAESRYKNPRNLCSGSVRQLDPAITKKRHVRLIVFSLVSAVREDGTDMDFGNSRSKEFQFLENLGFDVVEHRLVRNSDIGDAVLFFSQRVQSNDFPSDGLVLTYEDIAYGLSLGRTAKAPKHSIAFKWSDEIRETVLRDVEWSPSRTGLINPVAIFDPVELEGSTVSRASLHNISWCEDMSLGIGDHINVYKANMIIPQIAENLSKSGGLLPPSFCPACNGKTELRKEKDVKVLFCPNPLCPAKKIKNFALFVSRDALNIDGLSEATLEKLAGHGFVKTYADIFRLGRYRDQIISLDGFGEKSFENLLSSIEEARETDLYRVIYGLGIAGIGLANAKLLCNSFDNNLEKLWAANKDSFCAIDGIGDVLAENIVHYFENDEKMTELKELLQYLRFRETPRDGKAEKKLSGKSVVITGSLRHFSNRRELEELISAAGGKATGSVSAKTAYLVNNDINSTSGKNRKAKELGIPILTEEEFIKLLE